MKHLFILCAFLLVAGCQSATEKDALSASIDTEASLFQPSDTLTPAPTFAKETYAGGTYDLDASKGKVIIINFWATWCGPCVRETPAFVALQNEWADLPFEIVGISLDEEGFDIVGPFIEQFDVSYPMVLDDGTLADAFGGVYAMPSSFILDKQGRIVHRVVGEFPFEDLRGELERLLGA